MSSVVSAVTPGLVELAKIAVLSPVVCQLSMRVLNTSLSDFFAPTGVMRRFTRSFYFPYVCTAVGYFLICGLHFPSSGLFFSLLLLIGWIQSRILQFSASYLPVTIVSGLVPESCEQLMVQFQESTKNLITVEEFKQMEKKLKVSLSSEQKDIEGRIVKYINGDKGPLKEVAEIKFKGDPDSSEKGQFACTMAKIKDSSVVYYIPNCHSKEKEKEYSSIFRWLCFCIIFINAVYEKEKLSKLMDHFVKLYKVTGRESCVVICMEKDISTGVSSEKIKDKELVRQLVTLASKFDSANVSCKDCGRFPPLNPSRTLFSSYSASGGEEGQSAQFMSFFPLSTKPMSLKSMIFGDGDNNDRESCLINRLDDPNILADSSLGLAERMNMSNEDLLQEISEYIMRDTSRAAAVKTVIS